MKSSVIIQLSLFIMITQENRQFIQFKKEYIWRNKEISTVFGSAQKLFINLGT